MYVSPEVNVLYALANVAATSAEPEIVPTFTGDQEFPDTEF